MRRRTTGAQRSFRVLWALAMVLMCRGEALAGPHTGLGLWAGAYVGQSTVLRVGDLRPEDRTDGGLVGGLAYATARRLQFDVAYAYGASTTDFSNGVEAGRFRDEHKGVRSFVDGRFWPGSWGSAFGGIGYSYRETKSSLNGPSTALEVRGVDRSLAVRIGYQGRVSDHFGLRFWAGEFVHSADGTDPITHFRYDWVRGGTEASLELIYYLCAAGTGSGS